MVNLKKYDTYGLPVSLSFGQDRSYRTSFGLFMSGAFYLTLVSYFVVLIPKIWSDERSFTYLTSVSTDQ